jgi:uncharacterized protein YecE (DUF72 family)
MAAEINSSFYRPHQPATYARWAGGVPAGFRFSVKLPKTITHEKRLHGCADLLAGFLAQTAGLDHKLGCLLAQLPPSLAFDETAARTFFRTLRGQHAGQVALEPRHASWFTPTADAALEQFRVGRVLADPVRYPPGRTPGGWPGLVYLRLHGSPHMYYSSYGKETLQALALKLRESVGSGAEVWCIFDNTASGAAVSNALELDTLLKD